VAALAREYVRIERTNDQVTGDPGVDRRFRAVIDHRSWTLAHRPNSEHRFDSNSYGLEAT